MSLPENFLPKNLFNAPEPAEPSPAPPPSLWLYIAGFFVTLSGLYAVCFDLDSGAYRAVVYALATGGYLFSFGARRARISLRSLQTPALLALAALIALAASTNHGFDVLLPAEATQEHPKAWQLLIAWGAILQCYTLTTDAAVLFACVPSMTMIALVSTINTDPIMQNVFLVFVTAATFLMVHENYLRTQGVGTRSGAKHPDRRFLRGQVQLALLCVLSALALAKIAVVPIRMVGQTLFIPSAVSGFVSPSGRNGRANFPNSMMDHSDAIDIANGPVNASNQVLLTIQSSRGLYWRGATFDFYDGLSFHNTLTETTRLAPQESGASVRDMMQPRHYSPTPTRNTEGGGGVYNVPASDMDLQPSEMENSAVCEQKVHIVSGRFLQIYGAAQIEQARITSAYLNSSRADCLTNSGFIPPGAEYAVRSRVPDSDPARLRAASADGRPLPDKIRRLYLQRPNTNLWLRDLATKITANCTNDYDRAVAIQDYIGNRCQYNLQTPRAPREGDLVEYFLRMSKMGYCDSFGAAMAVLCRYAGVPARIASGFITGDYRDGLYILREKHRHIWTEVFIPKVGWVAFDATSSAEDVSDYPDTASKKGTGFWHWLLSGKALPPVLAALCVGLIIYVVWSEWRARRGGGRSRRKAARWQRAETNLEIAGTYQALCHALKRRGLERAPAMTPDEFAQWLTPRLTAERPELIAPLLTLTALYARARYGEAVSTSADVAQAKEAAAVIRQGLRQRRRRKREPLAIQEAG